MTTTADEQLAFAGPFELAELVRTKQVHPRELVELCLRRIETLDPRLNAFRATLADEAMAAAEHAAGFDGPLAGVPIAVKDDVPLAGQSTTRGSRTYGPPAVSDAECVRRLRVAGAIPVGITNVPELTIFPGRPPKPTGSRATHGTRAGRREGPQVGRRQRSLPGWSRSRPAPTAAGRSASRPQRAVLSG